ncbi:hypothetical protein V6N13_043933 [Hibiscus sabdariffa]|uniref:Uncharacterized protein n=1 Tax=Hibiscus sabdariffa TaxID=183260 RepID=A0ABR2RGZ2_9ROSI
MPQPSALSPRCPRLLGFCVQTNLKFFSTLYIILLSVCFKDLFFLLPQLEFYNTFFFSPYNNFSLSFLLKLLKQALELEESLAGGRYWELIEHKV